ncbi:MAG TPA: hypothetical protein VGC65_04575 [Bacteroidia bacterium]
MSRVHAQIVLDEELNRMYYDRTRRITKFSEMNDMRDVFHKDKFLLGKKRIMGNVAMNMGRIVLDDGKETQNELRSALSFYLRIRFFEEFSVNTTLYKDFNTKAVARWTSDYTYAIGRYNWRPKRFNFGYENYLNNKYTDNFKVFSDKFMQGYYFVSYSHLIPEKVFKHVSIDPTSSFRLTYVVRYALKYENRNKEIVGGLFSGKPTAGAGFRYTIFRNIYIESAFYLYLNPSVQKAPWDPDYTYGFGYFDWRSFRISLTYGNWAVNRFPWNKTEFPHYGFLDGNFRIVANYIW